jgi:hypothetical protein
MLRRNINMRSTDTGTGMATHCEGLAAFPALEGLHAVLALLYYLNGFKYGNLVCLQGLSQA